MADALLKLTPDRDLQCYFEQPSAVAAISDAAADRFTVSGCWRQQFDWAVIEWNRNNVFEHPAFRYLPDGDLSGLVLSYEERRTNCIAADSDLYPTVDWPYLRIWCDGDPKEQFHRVPLLKYAEAMEGEYRPATAAFQLVGDSQTSGFIALSWMWEHYVADVAQGDGIDTVLDSLAANINSHSLMIRAERTPGAIKLTYIPPANTGGPHQMHVTGNRVGVYSSTSADLGLRWNFAAQYLSGGTVPTAWRFVLPFNGLLNEFGETVPTTAVRKMRWTYAADFQRGEFQRSEFDVRITNWSVSGNRRGYVVAGPGTRRLEDDSPDIRYTNDWTVDVGNYSGGTIRYSDQKGASVTCTYTSPQNHRLYIGTRSTASAAAADIVVDGAPIKTVRLACPGEDFLHRVPAGDFGPGTHTIVLSRVGDDDSRLYFDFLEIAIPEATLPATPEHALSTLATDWDTDHSLALAPERTVWMIRSLGFLGRVNHYVGAMWFYELTRAGHQYSSAALTFDGDPAPGTIVSLRIWRKDAQPPIEKSTLQHGVFEGDTAESIAKAFEMQINDGFTGIRAEASGNALSIFSRSMGQDGNQMQVESIAPEGAFHIDLPEDAFTNGVDGNWYTDLTAAQPLNRAARDWSRAFFAACKSHGLDAAAAFSTELRHGDPSEIAGIAQRYPSRNPVLLNTPALQTNFSPASLSYWREVHLSMAGVMKEAGVRPYLQFGEVQYWYFPYDGSGLPFADEYTKRRFRDAYGREIAAVPNGNALPEDYPDEATLLPQLIGEFTSAIMSHVRASVPDTRFEVLYPIDVNDTPFNRVVNFPAAYWTPVALDNLKTESFTYTYARDLNLCKDSIDFPSAAGFPPQQRSHLIGIADTTSPWVKEVTISLGSGVESVVLFALDQFCLIGYPLSVLDGDARRSVRLG